MNPPISVSFPQDLYLEVLRIAEAAGLAPSEWLIAIVAEHLDNARRTEEFFRSRASRVSERLLREILENVGDNPPMPGDELEP